MSELNNGAWPSAEINDTEGFNIDTIFGSGNSAANQGNPFEVPAATVPTAAPVPTSVEQETPLTPAAVPALATAALNTEKVKIFCWHGLQLLKRKERRVSDEKVSHHSGRSYLALGAAAF